MSFTRRHLIQAATFWLARKEFWTSADPASWTAEQKQNLLYQSPWSRPGTLRLESEKKRGAQPSSSAPVPVPGERPSGQSSSKMPSVPIGEPIPPAPGMAKGEPPSFPVLVRWESAAPVRLAGGTQLPAEAKDFYVIRLAGMPLLPRRRGPNGEPGPDPNEDLVAAIKQTSLIERREKPAIPCSHLLRGSGEKATDLLLFFSRKPDPIAIAEKEVTVVSRFGSFRLAVRFPLKEMVVKGTLEL